MTIFNPNKYNEYKLAKMKYFLTEIDINPEVFLVKNDNKKSSNASLFKKRRTITMIILFLLMFTVLLSFGVGLLVYKHLLRKNYSEVFDMKYHDAKRNIGHFKEKIELDSNEGLFAKLEVPAIMEFQKSTVIHDFEMNFTAIIDHRNNRCHILPLNYTLIKPPKNIFDMIDKFTSGYYSLDAEVLKEYYKVVTPKIENPKTLGQFIGYECQYYDTYMLEKDDDVKNDRFISKRSSSLECSMQGNKFCLGETFGKFLPCLQLTRCI